MATLSDEHLRALRFLARHPRACMEATLLKQGFITSSATSYLLGLPRYEEEQAARREKWAARRGS